MKIKELDSVISEILMDETKKLIKEQIDGVDHLIDSVKSFQSLSGLVDKISEIEDAGSDGPVIFISIKGVTPEELVSCCGGDSLEHAQTNLMQGLHHDLEDNGFDGDFDIDVDTSGDENALHLVIRITPINDNTLGDTEMKEQTKDTNPTVDDKKDVILGGLKPQEATEQWQAMAGEAIAGEALSGAELSPVINKMATSALGSKIADALGGNDEEEVDEEDKKLTKTYKKMAKTESTQKKTITLNKAEMANLLSNIISEAVVAPSGGVLPGGVPGLDVTKKAIKDSGKENDSALKAVQKKIKDYLSFKGNDNPEFPNQIGKGDEKVATQNTSEEDEVVNDNRGRGPQDLDYDNEPSKRFKDRIKLSLVGSSEMGNPSDAGNAIKTDVGEKLHKNIEKRQENKSKEPIYPKEAVPVKTKPEKEGVRKENANSPAVASEIMKMKQLSNYNEKTQ